MYKDNLLSFSNSVFSAFAFYTGIIVLKVLIMAVCTGSLRRKNLVSTYNSVQLFHKKYNIFK